jgi:hypothetical protein
MSSCRKPGAGGAGPDHDLRNAIENQGFRNEYSPKGIRLRRQPEIAVSGELKTIIRRWQVDQSGLVISLQDWRLANGR